MVKHYNAFMLYVVIFYYCSFVFLYAAMLVSLTKAILHVQLYSTHFSLPLFIAMHFVHIASDSSH